MIDAQSVIQSLVTFAGLWIVIKVELRWLRADLKRTEEAQRDHSTRIRNLELSRR